MTIRLLALGTLAVAIGNPAKGQRPEAPVRTSVRMATATLVDTLPDPTSVKRWASLTRLLLAEFRRDKRDAVGNIQGDYSAREVKVRSTPADENAWVARTLTREELRTADLRAIAADLYGAAKRKAEQTR